MSLDPAKRENIVLIGFMGSGKSSIGRLIASKLRYRFVDTDQIIIRKTGARIAEIFATRGESYFREVETGALQSLKAGRGLVIATGGGIVTCDRNLPLLRGLGLVIWFRAAEEVIFRRVSRSKKRPLLETANPRETIHLLLAAREPLYAKAAQIAVDTSAGTHAEIAQTVITETQQLFPKKSPQ